MRISSQSYYGIKAIAYLAKKGGYSSVKEISQKEKIPYDYLEKILQKLAKNDLVKAKRGCLGGYFLKKPPRKITAQKVFNALDEEILPFLCLLEGKRTQLCLFEKTCLSKNFWKRLKKIIKKTLNSITLADLIYAKNKKSKSKSR